MKTNEDGSRGTEESVLPVWKQWKTLVEDEEADPNDLIFYFLRTVFDTLARCTFSERPRHVVSEMRGVYEPFFVNVQSPSSPLLLHAEKQEDDGYKGRVNELVNKCLENIKSVLAGQLAVEDFKKWFQ